MNWTKEKREMVGALKKNKVVFGELTKGEKDLFNEVGKDKCLIRAECEWTEPDTTAPFYDANAYRIKPDFHPPAEVGETNDKIFYMVFVEGKCAPTKKHVSRESARQEAERLCATTGNSSYVLKSVEMFIPPQKVAPEWASMEKEQNE